MAELSAESALEELTRIFRGTNPNPEKPYSYFARAIRGGRNRLENSRIIFSEMEKHSTVISKHVILDDVKGFEEGWKKRFPEINVYQRDARMIRMSQYFVADLSEESSGVGGEVGMAYYTGKPISLFSHEDARLRPTMISYRAGDSSPTTPTIEEVFRCCGLTVPIIYFNDQNVLGIVRDRFRTFFAKQMILPQYVPRR